MKNLISVLLIACGMAFSFSAEAQSPMDTTSNQNVQRKTERSTSETLLWEINNNETTGKAGVIMISSTDTAYVGISDSGFTSIYSSRGRVQIVDSAAYTGSYSTGAALEVLSTDAIMPPSGTTAQRPGSPTAGFFRYNTSNNMIEVYNGTSWFNLDTVSP